MDFELPGTGDPRRLAVRAWLGEHPSPSASSLADAGYVAPHWPEPWGLGADAEHQLLIDEELAAAGVARPDNPIGIGWAGPTIVAAGTAEQQARYLPPLLRGDEFWCQLFSEPQAGSDLAALATRAVRDGDDYVVNGQKLWSSYADRSDLGILLVRTGQPGEAKHRGITYLVCPMSSPGIDVRPITEMTGNRHFNEVFLDDVRIPLANRIGEESDGWGLARVTLGNERVSLSTGGVLWSMGPTTGELLDRLRDRPAPLDAVLRQRAAHAATEAELLRLLHLRAISAAEPGPEASVKKLLGDHHGQLAMNLAKDARGPAAMTSDPDDPYDWGFLFSPALTIGGGTAEVQRSIIAERILGLPRDV